MTAQLATPKRRPRRIAADEAHSWARNLRLGNPYAKLVLSMLTIYVNGEGSCFVSAAALAEDCELALETVRRRLGWLEGIGAITRLPQWLDEHGRRNGDGRGKRTTDEIRLMIHADPDEIEARAHGNGDDDGPVGGDETLEISPLPGGGANSVSPPISPLAAPSLGRGPDSLNREPEQDSPQPPKGGVQENKIDEGFQKFQTAWHFPITDLPKALMVWGALNGSEREQAITGAKGYRAYIDGERKANRNRAVKDAHRWLRDKLWLGYLNAGHECEARAERFDATENSGEWKAWDVFYRCCGGLGIPRFLIAERNGVRYANCPTQWPPDVGIDAEDWETVIEGTGQFAAWLRRLRELPGAKIATRTIVQAGEGVQALTVPSAWPPNRGSTGPPPPLSDEDAREFTK